MENAAYRSSSNASLSQTEMRKKGPKSEATDGPVLYFSTREPLFDIFITRANQIYFLLKHRGLNVCFDWPSSRSRAQTPDIEIVPIAPFVFVMSKMSIACRHLSPSLCFLVSHLVLILLSHQARDEC